MFLARSEWELLNGCKHCVVVQATESRKGRCLGDANELWRKQPVCPVDVANVVVLDAIDPTFNCYLVQSSILLDAMGLDDLAATGCRIRVKAVFLPISSFRCLDDVLKGTSGHCLPI